MASKPFVEITFAPGQAQQSINLNDHGVPPFNSGTWSILFASNPAVTASIRWSDVDTKETSRVKEMVVRVQYNTHIVLGPQALVLDGETAGESKVQQQTQGYNNHHSYYYGAGHNYIARLEWSMSASPPRPSSTYQAFAEKHTALLGAPHLNSIQFVFPRDGGRELWAKADVLSNASPYLKTLLESGFSEGQSSITHRSGGAIERSTLDFDDSDDDEAIATPPSPPPAPAHSCTFPHHRIDITQSSYTTYKALLCWIYTSHISWAPLSSSFASTSTGRSDALKKAIKRHPKLPSPASPKSVYRLAHLLEIPALQKLALAELKSQLTVANAAAELFSETSGRYDEVLEVVLEFIMKHRAELKSSEGWKKVLGQVEELPWGGRVAVRLAMSSF